MQYTHNDGNGPWAQKVQSHSHSHTHTHSHSHTHTMLCLTHTHIHALSSKRHAHGVYLYPSPHFSTRLVNRTRPLQTLRQAPLVCCIAAPLPFCDRLQHPHTSCRIPTPLRRCERPFAWGPLPVQERTHCIAAKHARAFAAAKQAGVPQCNHTFLAALCMLMRFFALDPQTLMAS
jgi:hypothetical protein